MQTASSNLLAEKCDEAVDELLVSVGHLFENDGSGRDVRELESVDLMTAKSDTACDVVDARLEKRLAQRRIGPLAKDRGHDEIKVGNGSGSHGVSSYHSRQKEELRERKALFKTVEMQFDTRQTATVNL